MPDFPQDGRRIRERPPEKSPYPQSPIDSGGPKRPDSTAPDVSKLLKKMKSIEKDKAKRYKQGVGE